MDDYNEKNEGAREALTSVARMAGLAFVRVRSDVRSRDEFRSTMLSERTSAN
jgi:hypothetical protein